MGTPEDGQMPSGRPRREPLCLRPRGVSLNFKATIAPRSRALHPQHGLPREPSTIITKISARYSRLSSRLSRESLWLRSSGSPSARQLRFAGVVSGFEAFLDAVLVEGASRIVLIDGPRVLGWKRWREIDDDTGGRSLREGLEAAMNARQIIRLDTDALATLIRPNPLRRTNSSPVWPPCYDGHHWGVRITMRFGEFR